MITLVVFALFFSALVVFAVQVFLCVLLKSLYKKKGKHMMFINHTPASDIKVVNQLCCCSFRDGWRGF